MANNQINSHSLVKVNANEFSSKFNSKKEVSSTHMFV